MARNPIREAREQGRLGALRLQGCVELGIGNQPQLLDHALHVEVRGHHVKLGFYGDAIRGQLTHDALQVDDLDLARLDHHLRGRGVPWRKLKPEQVAKPVITHTSPE